MDGLVTQSKIEEKIVQKATMNNIPLSGGFELLPLCNMNCDMCFIRLSQEEVNKSGRIRNAEEWLSLAKEMKEAGTLFILLTGGEPLLYKEFKKLYKGLKDMGMILTLNTNGTLINEEMADFLAENKPRRINITLYGGSNDTYERLCHNPKGFDQTVRGIKLLKERNVDVKMNVTVVKENLDDLPKIIETAYKLDVPFETNTYMFPVTKGIKGDFNKESRLTPKEVAHTDIALRYNTETEESFMRNRIDFLNKYEYGKQVPPPEYTKAKCRAGRSSFWVDWRGNLCSCVFLEDINMDVFENGFEKSWNYIVEETDKIRYPAKCNSCEKREICQTCIAAAYTETGSFDKSPNFLCKVTDELINILK